MSKEQKLKRLFASYPTVDRFHLTSDGQAFTTEDMAFAHAKELKDQEITSHNRTVSETLEKIRLKIEEQKDSGTDPDHVVTHADLDADTELSKQGVNVGDPVEVSTSTEATKLAQTEKKPAKKAAVKVVSKTAKEKTPKAAKSKEASTPAEAIKQETSKVEEPETTKPVESTESETSKENK